MHILPIKTPILKAGDNLATMLMEHADIRDGDIIAISSKAIATVEGAAINLAEISPSREAMKMAATLKKDAEYYQVVLDETARMNGAVIQSVNGIVLTELQPDGMTEGTILVPNAGLDRSNIKEGWVIGWPVDPVASAESVQETLGNVGIIVTDSGLSPRRKGVGAFALCVAGFDPLVSMAGEPDLFGRPMHVTEEAIADQLATTANILMGNTDQSVPAVIIRDHTINLSEYSGWVEGIRREIDIYHQVI